MGLTIKWNRGAIIQFDKAIAYILSKSVQNAEKVEIDFIKSIEKLKTNPERYPEDKFKLNNDGSFRAFELHRYRISYRYLKKGNWDFENPPYEYEPFEILICLCENQEFPNFTTILLNRLP